MRFFGAQFSGGGAKLVFLKKLVKKGVSEKKKCAPFFWGVLALLPCCCMMSLDALEGCTKNPIKIVFFLSTLLLDAEETEKEEKKGPQKSNTQFLGGLENGQEVVPPFLSKKSGFSKSSKTPIFYSVSRKNGWQPFFSKRLCYKEDRLRGKNK